MNSKKVYLGDGLYARHDGFSFWLSAENGVSVQDEICLEPEVLQSFFDFIKRTLKLHIKITPAEGHSAFVSPERI